MHDKKRDEELLEKLNAIETWECAEKILKDENIPLDRQTVRNLDEIIRKGVEETDSLIDQISDMFVIRNDTISVRIKFGKWMTISKNTFSKLAKIASK